MSIETNCLFDFKLNDQGVKKVMEAKKSFSNFQQDILGRLPKSREASIVRTKLEEASFYVTRAIAQSESNHTEIVTH